jgi:hypothetical protein
MQPSLFSLQRGRSRKRGRKMRGGDRTDEDDVLHKHIIQRLLERTNDEEFMEYIAGLEQQLYERSDMNEFCDEYVKSNEDLQIGFTKHIFEFIESMYRNNWITDHIKLTDFITNLLFSCIYEINENGLWDELDFGEQIIIVLKQILHDIKNQTILVPPPIKIRLDYIVNVCAVKIRMPLYDRSLSPAPVTPEHNGLLDETYNDVDYNRLLTPEHDGLFDSRSAPLKPAPPSPYNNRTRQNPKHRFVKSKGGKTRRNKRKKYTN